MLTNMYCKADALLFSVNKFLKEEAGVTAIEYAVVAAGVTALVAVLFGSTGTVSKMLTAVFTKMQTNITNLLK